MTPYDLHSHSTASDGLLAPAALVERAAARGVRILALTDHDQVAGLDEARDAAARLGIRLVDGVELSVSWRDLTLHVVGLRIDPAHPALCEGLRSIREGRTERGRRMAASLEKTGVRGAYEGAMRYVADGEVVSRTHFARFLVERGYVREVRNVFKRYLAPGKPGYVRHEWASLVTAIGWVHCAGGQAVLAHPGRYPLSGTARRALLAEFRDAGGDAIEVLTASHTAAQASEFGALARHYGLLSSSGSDFHGPGESWLDLGALPPLPETLAPVWKDW